MASVTVNLPLVATVPFQGAIQIIWTATPRPDLGTTLSNGEQRYLSSFILRNTLAFDSVEIGLSPTLFSDEAGADFSDEMEMSGSITAVASNGSMLVITGLIDATEPYAFNPPNEADVVVFANLILGLTDQSITLTFDDNQPVAAAPSFADDTGDAQTWEMGTAITAITVPEADGTPRAHLRCRGRLARWHRL